jgi:hypothetical protein
VVLGSGLGPTAAATPTADQTARATAIAAALSSEVTTFLAWPDGTGVDAHGVVIPARTPTAGETAELLVIGQVMGANLWARRDAPNGIVAAFTGDAGQVMRVARDAIDTVRPWLERIRHGAGGNFG